MTGQPPPVRFTASSQPTKSDATDKIPSEYFVLMAMQSGGPDRMRWHRMRRLPSVFPRTVSQGPERPASDTEGADRVPVTRIPQRDDCCKLGPTL